MLHSAHVILFCTVLPGVYKPNQQKNSKQPTG